ncbi:hypothetical protein PILCRDRAFT_89079 [Piloderma croceum F 1598]|uniref:Uncharacterized protein n=1 Tax=Piloderma croceum (strain F 1598) TaxID=765440 RepID=A0A0C3FPK0_PILCF|nr:hypothetical protein PILCRDRAFT_89079 [Piloderma croceum F 1598]
MHRYQMVQDSTTPGPIKLSVARVRPRYKDQRHSMRDVTELMLSASFEPIACGSKPVESIQRVSAYTTSLAPTRLELVRFIHHPGTLKSALKLRRNKAIFKFAKHPSNVGALVPRTQPIGPALAMMSSTMRNLMTEPMFPSSSECVIPQTHVRGYLNVPVPTLVYNVRVPKGLCNQEPQQPNVTLDSVILREDIFSGAQACSWGGLTGFGDHRERDCWGCRDSCAWAGEAEF